MIYKFKFEVYADDNERLITAISEESGDFVAAVFRFIHYVVGYANHYGLYK